MPYLYLALIRREGEDAGAAGAAVGEQDCLALVAQVFPEAAVADVAMLLTQGLLGGGLSRLTAQLVAQAREHKRSWDRDMRSIKRLANVFTGKRLPEITPVEIEPYKMLRLGGMDRLGRHPKPTIVNRELACLRSMFNVARKRLVHLPGGGPNENPVSRVKFFDERNIRDRVLTAEEFQRMLDASPESLKPILHCAYYAGMRRGEILELTWDRVDLKRGFIQLQDADTKTDAARNIPIGRELREVLRHLPVALDSPGVRVP